MSAQDRPLFRFVHATDLHIESGNRPLFPLANPRSECLVRDINRLNEDRPVSFALLSGDLSNRGSMNEADLLKARELIARLEVPFHVVAGNHDVSASRRIAEKCPDIEAYQECGIGETGFARVFGREGLRFSFEKHGYHFMGVSLRDEDPDGALDWLEGELDSAAGRCFLITHYGLYPPRDAGQLSTWGFTRIAGIRKRLQELVRAPGVIAYLHGHNHVNSVMNIDGVYHISGGAVQKGCTGYRLFECYRDRVESNFLPLSDPELLNFNFWTDIVGEEQCLDSEHRTVEEYHRGNDREQELVIRF